MALRVPWDKYEAIILLEAWLQIKSGVPKMQMVNLVSYQLRLKAVNQGLEIDDIFRNINGISFQLTSMATAYEKMDMGKPASKLFTEIVELYLADPSAYQNMKEEVLQMVAYSSATKDDFARYVYATQPQLATKILESIGFMENFAISTKALSHSIFENLTDETITILKRKVLNHKFFIVKYKKYLSLAELGLQLLADYIRELPDGKTDMIKNEKTANTIIKTNDADILVHTKVLPNIYKKSMLQINSINGIYDVLCKKYHEIKSSTEQEWGSDKQWKSLYGKIEKAGSLSSVIVKEFGSVYNLSMMIKNAFIDTESDRAWLLWIAMKVFGTKENKYLSGAVKKSDSVHDLIELIFTDLLCYKHDATDFLQLYQERKQLIEDLPDNNLALIQNYCNLVGKYDKDAVYYLTNLSEKEKRTFLYYLGKANYTFTEEEILSIVKYAFPELYDYLGDFEFNDRNTKNPTNDSFLLPMLTAYFHDYKLQKVTNRIFPEFMKNVEEYAVSRPFTKLLPRISIVKGIDKSNAQIHFFDALGVEYLAYILKKCESLNLQTSVHISHCELPSITGINKDFIKFFKLDVDSDGNEKIPGTKDLDELKHHSKEIDYRYVKEPIHLFFELSIIDRELRQIQEMLANHEFDKIIIISDHGASRLSVIHQTICKMHTLDNHGKHSGRCCPVSEDPNLPEVAYDNGGGQKGFKDNPSIERQIKVNAQMLKLLSELDIKTSNIMSEVDNEL